MRSSRMLAILVVACLLAAHYTALAGDVPSKAKNLTTCRKRAAKLCGPSDFTFYMHNIVYDPNVDNKDNFNSVYGQPPNVTWPNPLFFGVTSTFEDPITKGPANDSKQIGVAHGFWQFDSKVNLTLFVLFTANITTGDHKGTIAIFGQMREIDPVRYLTVIGGTGDFLGARGLASCGLVQIDRVPPGRWTLSFDLDLYY